MFCKYCGREIENDSQFCRFCGQSMTGNNFTEFNNSIRIRVERHEPNFYKENQDKVHLCFIVISKDQKSVSIVEDDINKVDFYDCYAIIALLRYDCRNGYGFHYNRFENLGFYTDKLEPISRLKIGNHSVINVDRDPYYPGWGYIKGKDFYDNYEYSYLGKDKTLIDWGNWKNYR